MGFMILMFVVFAVVMSTRRGGRRVRLWHRWEDLLETGDRPDGVSGPVHGRHGRDIRVRVWAGPGMRVRGMTAPGVGGARAGRARHGVDRASTHVGPATRPKPAAKYESPEQRLQRQFVDGTLSIEEYERELDRLIRH